MPHSATFVLVITAFICTIASAWNPSKVPIWIPVFLLCVIALLTILPK